MKQLWGMNSSMFGLWAAVTGVILYLIALVLAATHGVDKVAMGVGGAAALFAWAIGMGKLFIRFAKAPGAPKVG